MPERPSAGKPKMLATNHASVPASNATGVSLISARRILFRGLLLPCLDCLVPVAAIGVHLHPSIHPSIRLEGSPRFYSASSLDPTSGWLLWVYITMAL